MKNLCTVDLIDLGTIRIKILGIKSLSLIRELMNRSQTSLYFKPDLFTATYCQCTYV
jgi:hypothetical protein